MSICLCHPVCHRTRRMAQSNRQTAGFGPAPRLCMSYVAVLNLLYREEPANARVTAVFASVFPLSPSSTDERVKSTDERRVVRFVSVFSLLPATSSPSTASQDRVTAVFTVVLLCCLSSPTNGSVGPTNGLFWPSPASSVYCLRLSPTNGSIRPTNGCFWAPPARRCPKECRTVCHCSADERRASTDERRSVCTVCMTVRQRPEPRWDSAPLQRQTAVCFRASFPTCTCVIPVLSVCFVSKLPTAEGPETICVYVCVYLQAPASPTNGCAGPTNGDVCMCVSICLSPRPAVNPRAHAPLERPYTCAIRARFPTYTCV